MRNEYMGCSHILKVKFREVLRLFCEDLNAFQIFNIAKINRNTANCILQLLRARIVEFAEESHVLAPDDSTIESV